MMISDVDSIRNDYGVDIEDCGLLIHQYWISGPYLVIKSVYRPKTDRKTFQGKRFYANYLGGERSPKDKIHRLHYWAPLDRPDLWKKEDDD